MPAGHLFFTYLKSLYNCQLLLTPSYVICTSKISYIVNSIFVMHNNFSVQEKVRAWPKALSQSTYRPNWAGTVRKGRKLKGRSKFSYSRKAEHLKKQHWEKPQDHTVLTWLARKVPECCCLSFIHMGLDILVLLCRDDSPQFCMGKTDAQKFL